MSAVIQNPEKIVRAVQEIRELSRELSHKNALYPRDARAAFAKIEELGKTIEDEMYA